MLAKGNPIKIDEFNQNKKPIKNKEALILKILEITTKILLKN